MFNLQKNECPVHIHVENLASTAIEDYEIDFTRLGRDFFMCYFGGRLDVSVTELAKILGSHAVRNWGKMFQAWVEMRKAPHTMRRGRVRVTPGTLAVWFERESNRRS
jgi:hypothetical protein